MRVATFAAETGHGYEFALAASRLAFAGGYHLDDPAILADAASAAGLHAGWMHAARDAARDELVAAAGERLAAVGADRMPALALRRALVWGEARVNDALSSARPARAVGMS
jgi:2-hydroxychromene-2-carboxylate isomerase